MVYWKSFADNLYHKLPSATGDESNVIVPSGFGISSSDAVAALEKQNTFFTCVDRFQIEPLPAKTRTQPSRKDPYEARIDTAVVNLHAAMVPERMDVSDTVVMEAAFFLINEGLLDIPDVQETNVKQAHAFLWNAAWLQTFMSARWREEGRITSDDRHPMSASMKDFNLLIMGPGGTGKTSVLRLTEALITFFTGSNTVQKLAPSNAAARLLGGDTLHSLCKLPFGDRVSLSTKKGRLSKEVLRSLRSKWDLIVAGFLDEVSMVSSDQFLHFDVRLRQAKMKPDRPFGGLAFNFCFDFLQLPPVDKYGTRPSLAKPIDDLGRVADDEDVNNEETKDLKKEMQAEARQGFDLWRSLRRVVCLTVNIRAQDALGRLQAEMRAGTITDEMWALYQSRIITAGDPRLTAPGSPFVEFDVRFIVHRHRIRVMRSLENAKAQSQKLQTPLYSVQARDEVLLNEDAPKVTDEVRADLLRRVNPEQTKGLPSFLPLHVGMRLLLSSKDCVRFGLVRGCSCVVRDIIFSDDEALPMDLVAGHIHSLTYMH